MILTIKKRICCIRDKRQTFQCFYFLRFFCLFSECYEEAKVRISDVFFQSFSKYKSLTACFKNGCCIQKGSLTRLWNYLMFITMEKKKILYCPICNYFLIYFFYWKIIALQNFVAFCQTSTWISHRYTYIPSLLNLSPISFPIPPL